MDKREFRREMRARRRRLSPQVQQRAAEKLRDQVVSSYSFLTSRRIATYVPVGGEIDTTPIAFKARQMFKRCYLPILHPYRPRRLVFAQYEASSQMKPNRVGIDEPQVDPKRWFGPQQLDLILLPLVGFSTTGMRIGMGGGYYDTSLEYLNYRDTWKKPKLIGVAYEFQKFDAGQVTADSWDVRLDGVFTESRFYICKD